MNAFRWSMSTAAAMALLLAAAATASAFQWSDSGWTPYGSTQQSQQFQQRIVDIQLDQAASGVVYIHKDGEATRGDNYPYLPFGLTTPLQWERNGLFDLTVGSDQRYLFNHLSAVPTFQFHHKGIDAVVFEVTFPCGDDGRVSLIIGAAAGQPYLDMTLDLSDFERRDEPITLVLRCIPSHSGKVDGQDTPFNRMARSAVDPAGVSSGAVAVASDRPWMLFYDQVIAGGSCGLLFDPRAVSTVGVTGQHRLNVALNLKPGAPQCRFYLWEFLAQNGSLADATNYFQQEADQLTGRIQQPGPASLGRVQYKVMRATGPVAMDGGLQEPLWHQAEWSEPFASIAEGNAVAGETTRFKAVYDDDYLYLAIRSDEIAMADRQSTAAGHDDSAIFHDDSIELFLSPQNTAADYLHLVFNSAGAKRDAVHSAWQGGDERLDWDPQWDVAIDLDGNRWTAEVRLPFDQLLLTEEVNDTWMLNVARNDRAGTDQPSYVPHQSWSRIVGGFHQPEFFNELTGIDADLSGKLDPDGFAAFGMIAPRRGDPGAVLAGQDIEVVEEGSNELYLYYPHKNIYLPTDGTVMRTIFTFTETRNAYTELWTAKHGLDASRQYAAQVAFHFRLPPGVGVAADHAFMKGAYMAVEQIGAHHVVLRPMYPADHGEMWNFLRLDHVPIFLDHTLGAGARVPVDSWVEYENTGEKSSVVRSYVNIVDFPHVDPIERFVIDPFWRYYSEVRGFPNYLQFLRRVGFNGFSVFAGDLLDDAGKEMTSYDPAFAATKRADLINLAAQARGMGLDVNLWDSTFNRFGLHPTVARWGDTPYANPFYVGPVYWYDIRNVTDAYEALGGADLVTMDIEVFKRVTEPKFGFFDQSPSDAARVRQLADERNTTIEDVFTDEGTRMIRDVRNKLDQSDVVLDIDGDPPIVVWNVRLDDRNPMEGLFDGHKVFPEHVQYLNPHVYDAGRDMRSAGSRIRFHVVESGSRQVMACLTTAFKVHYTYQQVRDQLLEVFFNGATGVQYWPEDFDQNDAYGQLLALHEIAPVQDILADGELHVQTPDMAAATQVVGFVHGGKAAILASNYRDGGPTAVQIANPLNADTAVYDLQTRAKVADLPAGQSIEVVLDERRAKAFYFGPGLDVD